MKGLNGTHDTVVMVSVGQGYVPAVKSNHRQPR